MVCTVVGVNMKCIANTFASFNRVIEDICSTEEKVEFYVFERSPFGRMAEYAVREAKKRYPNIELTVVLSRPYMYDDYMEYLEKRMGGRCDSVVLPNCFFCDSSALYAEMCHRITKWLVEKGEMLIFYTPPGTGYLNRVERDAPKVGLPAVNIFYKAVSYRPEDKTL